MSSQPEPLDRSATIAQPETANLGVQLTEMLAKFSEMTTEMAAQRKLIDQLISGGVQPEPAPVSQPEPESFVIPTTQTTFTPSFIIPPEETFTYTTANLTYTYPPNPSFFPTHMQGPQPQITSNIPPEPHTFYHTTAEPFLPDHTVQAKPEVGESSAPVDMKLLKRLDRFDEFMRKRAPGHSTANCRLFKHKIQDMLEAGEIVIKKKEEQGLNVSKNPLPEHADTIGVIMDNKEFEELVRSMSNKTEVFGIMDQPFEIEEAPYEEDKKPFILDLTLSESEALEPVVIEFPEQVPVLSLRQVPRNYSEPVLQIRGKQILKEEVSAVTRSGKIASSSTASAPIKLSNHEPTPKPAVAEKEAWDFLKRLKRSEYNVIEQLNKMPAQISILDLLFSSDLHRDALLEVLTKAQIPKDISVDNFSHIVGNVLTSKQITFSDEELPAEGTGHNKALYIAVRCNGKMLPKVLIDNGSALNICPWNTLIKLGCKVSN
nr:uncharacterized protein LOC113700823 [Coffea arabica]